jgi:hypothetical protein
MLAVLLVKLTVDAIPVWPRLMKTLWAVFEGGHNCFDYQTQVIDAASDTDEGLMQAAVKVRGSVQAILGSGIVIVVSGLKPPMSRVCWFCHAVANGTVIALVPEARSFHKTCHHTTMQSPILRT